MPDEGAESGNKENDDTTHNSVVNSLKIVKKVNRLIKNVISKPVKENSLEMEFKKKFGDFLDNKSGESWENHELSSS